MAMLRDIMPAMWRLAKPGVIRNYTPMHCHRLLFVVVALLLFTTGMSTAWSKELESSGGSTQSKLAEIDKALLHELIKLAKFNVHFHLEANHHQKWRSLTYPAGREAGTALTFSATLIDLKQQAIGLDNPARISRNSLKKAVTCGITGNAISGGASALELAQNTWVMLKARQNGYSPARSLAFVQDVVATTDTLLSQREELVRSEDSREQRRTLELETKLVRRMRQQLLFEFGTWSCHSRDQAWRENTFYALDSAQNFTRMSAGIFAMKAFKNPNFARSSVICALVANSVATINPIARNLVGFVVRKHQERKLARAIPFKRPADDPELDALQDTPARGSNEHQDSLRRVAALNARSEKMDRALDRETKDIERYRQIAQQQSISGPLIGLTGVASSTLATVAVYGYPRDIDTSLKLGFSGRITQGCGQAYSLVNTPYTAIRGAIKKRNLRKRGELPEQILEKRLQELDKLEARAAGNRGPAAP